MPRIRSSLGICVWAACIGLEVPPTSAAAPRFEIYRVDFVEGPAAPALERQVDDPRFRHTFVTQEYAAATAVKHDLTNLDVVEFCWATQHVYLTPEGAQRWDSLGGSDVSLAGLPIQVFVDGEPRYAAFVWNPLSSLSCRLPQFWCRTWDNRLTIGSRYASAEGDTILGAAYDAQVKQLFLELGKLTEDCRLK